MLVKVREGNGAWNVVSIERNNPKYSGVPGQQEKKNVGKKISSRGAGIFGCFFAQWQLNFSFFFFLLGFHRFKETRLGGYFSGFIGKY